MTQLQAPFPWRHHVLILVVIAIGTALPYLVSVASLGISNAIGCDLGTFAEQSCLVASMDWGPALREIYGLGWMILATLPLGGGAFIAWSVIAIIHRLAWGRLEKAEGQ